MNIETIIISAIVSIAVSVTTAYITARLRVKEEHQKWEREFALKYAEIRAKDRVSAESMARQFNVGYLIVEQPDGTRDKVFIPVNSGLTVGRISSNDIVVNHRSVSRTHMAFQVERSEVWAVNLSASTGILLNDANLHDKTRLQSGDVLVVGETRITYCKL